MKYTIDDDLRSIVLILNKREEKQLYMELSTIIFNIVPLLIEGKVIEIESILYGANETLRFYNQRRAG